MLKHWLKLAIKPYYKKKYLAIKKLKNMPRYTETKIDLLDKEVELVDSLSKRSMYQEIFEKGIYQFKSDHNSPKIIDCGAN